MRPPNPTAIGTWPRPIPFPGCNRSHLHAIINRSLRLCYMSGSGIVDICHLTAITETPLGYPTGRGGQKCGQDVVTPDVATMNNRQVYAGIGMSHDWCSVHPSAEASEVCKQHLADSDENRGNQSWNVGFLGCTLVE